MTLDDTTATRAIEAVRDELRKRGKKATIAVADSHGELIALLRMHGAQLNTGPIATNKAFTAARLRQPSRAVGTGIRERGYQLGYYGDARYCGWGGGLPVAAADGEVIGAVAVSGLTEDEDEEFAAIGVAALLG